MADVEGKGVLVEILGMVLLTRREMKQGGEKR